MALIYPPKYEEEINTKTWKKEIEDITTTTKQELNGFLVHCMVLYKDRGYTGKELWYCMKDDFNNWSKDIWAIPTKIIIRDFRNFLRENGVFVPIAGGNIGETIQKEVIDAKEEHIWTEQEFEEQAKKKISSNWKEAIGRSSQTLSQLLPNYTPTPAIPQPIPQPPIPQPPIPQLSIPQLSIPQPSIPQPSIPQIATTIEPLLRPRTQSPLPQPKLQQSLEIDRSISKQITELTKLYSDPERKFSGELYDILNSKLRIFYDCCRKVGLGPNDYHDAFSIMLKGRASTFYYDRLAGKGYDFERMIYETRCHFETEQNKQLYLSEWRSTTFQRIAKENPTTSRLDCLQKLFDRLQVVQRGLSESYQEDLSLRDQVINACQGIKECRLALYNPADTYEGVCAQLRSSIGTAQREAEIETSQYAQTEEYDHNWTDRTYGGRGRGYSRRSGQRYLQDRNRQKKCYICGKPNCWSTRHPYEERKEAYDKFRQKGAGTQGVTAAYFQSFLIQQEGVDDLACEPEDSAIKGTQQLLMDLEIEEYPDDPSEQFFTAFGELNGIQTVSILNDQSAFHSITGSDVFNEPTEDPAEAFSFDDRYAANSFQGIMPDTGAAGVSTAGEPQVQALQQIDKSVQIDRSTAGQHIIRFGKGKATSCGTIRVQTPVGHIVFQVVPTNTPFLFCLADMDRMGVRFDNLENVLVQGDKRIPIVRKWGHPWLLLHQQKYQLERSVAWSHLTEPELRQLHRRFGHPSAHRLFRILQRAGYQETGIKVIEQLVKYCHHCQMHQKSPSRFRFTLKDDHDFNFCVIIDILYLSSQEGSKPVLQVVDSATSFQAARFLKDMSARNTWDTLRLCWVDTYLGPPDQIVHDAGKNFASIEFRQQAKAFAIDVKEIPVEAHNSIGKVERYHVPLRRAYEIISAELEGTDKEIILQMAVKAINDSAGPDGLIPTLLVFGAYPRMTDESPPSPSITQRAEAIRKAMKELQRLQAARQINDALRMRNGPNTSDTIDLPLQSEVRVWREKGGWSGPHKLIATDGRDGQVCVVQMPYGPTKFRSTVVKPYLRASPNPEPTQEEAPNEAEEQGHEEQGHEEQGDEGDPEQHAPEAEQPKRGRGRPKGSKNRRHRQYPTDYPADYDDLDFEEHFLVAAEGEGSLSISFITEREKADLELAKQLRKEGRITTPGAPFEASAKQEIEGLIARGVFKFERYNAEFEGIRIFKSRIVNEVKGKATDTPYEKSRLVVQGYNDEGKEVILTQSPTIQRASQRVIVALAPTLIATHNFALQLRDITQAYTQSETHLRRLIIAHLPEQIRHLYPCDTIMVVLKPLYGIAEAGTHWWATYSRHHRERLSMITSTFDPCLLITSTGTPFGIVGMQTDDTIILSDSQFSKLEEEELIKAKLKAKPKEQLDLTTPLIFNGCVLSLTNDSILLCQKGQGKKISIISTNPSTQRQEYIEQRARGAYIASICQPEASFDLSIAAQHQEPTTAEVAALNKRLLWQLGNIDRGLKYVPIDLTAAKLFVFVDGSFANNKDFSSQLGYEIIIANETTHLTKNLFTINGNLIHWSSTKSKRVTRSVLASEIYGMVSGVDMAIAIGTTLKLITDRLAIPMIPLIVCTDSYSLYECLVKLGTTKEKRLMIDIMALRQSYERRELFEIRWINGGDNPADAMTKGSPNKALETFVNTNSLQVRVEGWVKRRE